MSPTTQNPPEDLPIQETSTGSNEGIERILTTSLDESAGSGQLLIRDTTNGSSEIPIEEIELSDKNVTVTEDNDQTLATTTEPNVEKLPQVTFSTNSPRFTEFINMVRGATTSSPKLDRPDIDQPHTSSKGNPPTDLAEGENRGRNEELPESNEDIPDASQARDLVESEEETVQQVTVTRQEVLALSSVLDKIPKTALVRGDRNVPENITLTVVGQAQNSPVQDVQSTSQGETTEHPPDDLRPHSSSEELPLARGKRRRPKYSLTSAMLKKHPVVQYFATGPLDRNKNPYKWWCRVCKIELSLMSRGVLELLSHYETEAHLTKEHRIRLETPGLPLFDQEENELRGIGLQEAKRRAREAHPIAPQLDGCRLLVGQERLPEFSSVTSPSESVLAQICILENGFRHGGHINVLLGLWEDITRLSPGSTAQITTHNWSQHRIYVSTFLFLFTLLMF